MVELVCIVLELQCIIVRCHFSTDVYDQQQQLKRWLDLRLDFDSTALRPFDDLRYDRRPACCGPVQPK